jgi:glycosyltransferase involved in cell wall biosynthesis
MKAPFFTVLIDTYNYGQYVEEAVASVLAQDFPAEQREILVVDDGSTDDTQERMQKFGDAIRYLRKPNGGQASAFNFGFEHARGEVVALLDADDVWLPGKLQIVCEAFSRNAGAGLVYHRYIEMDTTSQTQRDSGYSLISGHLFPSRKRLLSYAIYPTSTLAIRVTALRRLLPVPTELTFQADAYLAGLIVFVAPVLALREPLAVYRIHGNNLFGGQRTGALRTKLERRMNTRKALHDRVAEWLSSNSYDVKSEPISSYLAQWEFAQACDRFQIEEPDRWTYFRHLWREARVYGELRSPRHRLATYANALAGLIGGYQRQNTPIGTDLS